MSNQFNKRVYGSVILKSVNSNFNADFTSHPRTLSDGVVYATDKALKYAIKDYFRKNLKNEKVFYVKRLNDNMNPLSLNETYEKLFGEFQKQVKKNKKGVDGKEEQIIKTEVLNNLLQCLDIRLFGATFAGETNISIHGPVQINHGVNRFPENDIYTENILSPFRNEGKKDSSENDSGDEDVKEKENSTIGNQTNLKEGHYVYHFSVNPKNIDEHLALLNNDLKGITPEDIVYLKQALNCSVTMLDSSRKMGTENEATLWVELKEGSLKIIPSFTEMTDVRKENGKIVIDLSRAAEVLRFIDDDIEKIELYFNPALTGIDGLKEGGKVKFFNILQF